MIVNYAGIGTKKLSSKAARLCRLVAKYMAEEGHTLVTGGSPGASQQFANSALKHGGNVELWLPNRFYEYPWVRDKGRSRNGDRLTVHCIEVFPWFFDYDLEAVQAVEKYHPDPKSIEGKPSQAHHARDYRTIVPASPVDLVIAYPGPLGGGAKLGVRLARDRGIPIIRLDQIDTAKEARKKIRRVLKGRADFRTIEDSVRSLLPSAPPHLLVVDAQKQMVAKSFSSTGTPCPTCRRLSKVYARSIHSEVAHFLVRLVDKYLRTQQWCNIKDVIPGGNKKSKSSTDGAYLVHWDFIEKKPKTTGFYRPTEKGIQFVLGEIDAPQSVYLYQNILVDFSDERTDIHASLGDKFNLSKVFKRINKRRPSHRSEL